MLSRSLVLALLVLAALASPAQAGFGDLVLPIRDAADGVEAVMGKRQVVLRFRPAAAKLYREFAGRKVSVGCGRWVPGEDGSEVGGGLDPDTGIATLDGSGYIGSMMRMPRKAGRVLLPFGGDPFDVCYLATPPRRGDRRFCLDRNEGIPGYPPDCVRLIVPLTEQGRAQIDLRARMIELGEVGSDVEDGALPEVLRTYGRYVATLEHPDAAPPAGKVGVFIQGTTRVAAVVLRDGTRKFMRWDGDVYSTNAPEFAGGGGDPARLP